MEVRVPDIRTIFEVTCVILLLKSVIEEYIIICRNTKNIE